MIPGFFFAGMVAAGGGATDPYWSNVVSLLNFPGANGSTTFTDEKGKTWSPSGSIHISTSLGYNTCECSGSDYLSTASDADWSMGTGDFTIEAWIYPTSLSGDRSLLNVNIAGGVSFGLSSGKVFCGPTNVSYGATGATTISTSVLTHVAAARDSGTMRVFVNGLLDASASDSYNYAQASATLGAGHVPPSTPVGYYYGYMKAIRVTKGVARYTAAFTPDAAPWPTS